MYSKLVKNAFYGQNRKQFRMRPPRLRKWQNLKKIPTEKVATHLKIFLGLGVFLKSSQDKIKLMYFLTANIWTNIWYVAL